MVKLDIFSSMISMQTRVHFLIFVNKPLRNRGTNDSQHIVGFQSLSKQSGCNLHLEDLPWTFLVSYFLFSSPLHSTFSQVTFSMFSFPSHFHFPPERPQSLRHSPRYHFQGQVDFSAAHFRFQFLFILLRFL